MIRRGPKPKSPQLRLVEGNYRPDRHGPAPERAPPLARLEMPKGMKGKAADAWRRFIAPANWLDKFKEPSAIAFCELWAEFQAMPGLFVASRHAQMRAYMGELGLTDTRNRPVTDLPKTDEFFDD
jgi:hypothetical protein